jgi:4-hydroxybenzoate polyprenyltransferase
MSVEAPSPVATVREIAADIKLAHSVFALPFALLAAFMAAETGGFAWSDFAGQLGLIVLAMVLARTVAMLANRWLDREIDARNPRTAGRAIPAGRLPASRALAAIGLCSILFMAVCASFGVLYANWWPTILGLPVLAWIAGYGYVKRFTSLCHLWLGSSLAISPLAAAIAVDPAALAEQPAIWLLSGMVLFWVAGFDVVYALQDIEIDRRDGLYSIPARFGETGALWISRTLHAAAVACLVASWLIDPRFAILFGLGVAVVALLLIYEHATVARWGTTKIALAFFTLNGVISIVLGGLGIADVMWG